MRVIKQVLRLHDRCERQTAIFKHTAQFSGAVLGHARAQQREHPVSSTNSVVVGDQTRISLQISQVKCFAKNRPLRVTHHGQKDLLTAFDGEHVIHRPG